MQEAQQLLDSAVAGYDKWIAGVNEICHQSLTNSMDIKVVRESVRIWPGLGGEFEA